MREERKQKINGIIKNDPFARFLGAEVEIVKPGHSRVTLTVTSDMLNFHGMTHGGVIFAVGDMAFAAASNSHEQTASGPIVLYDITIRDERSGEIVAKSQNLVYRKKEWFVPEE